MNILLYTDVFLKYFDSKYSFKKNKLQLYVVSLIENESNQFLFSDNYLKHLEQYFRNDGKFYDLFTTFFTELSDSGRIQQMKSGNSNSFDEEYSFLSTYFDKGLLLNIYALNNSLPFKNQSNDVVIQNIDFKPNIQSVLFILCAIGTCTFSYSDFLRKNDVDEFFNKLLKITDDFHKYEFNILSRESDIEKCSCLNIIKTKNIKINLYTKKFKSTTSANYFSNKELIEIKNKLKKCFGNNLRLFLTTNHDLIHERSIVYDNFIITVDDDFFNLKPERKTWQIVIHYSQSKVAELLKKCKQFHEFS